MSRFYNMESNVIKILTVILIAMMTGTALANGDNAGKDERKSLIVQRLPQGIAETEEIHSSFDSHGVKWNEIGCSNWQRDYPYKPIAQFRMAHDGQNIYVEYHVKEGAVRAMNSTDQSAVFQDACCEFFLMMDGEDTYYNIESNCIGAILMQGGRQNGVRTEASDEELKSIKRWGSLGKETFDTRVGEQEWWLTLIIPASALFKSNVKSLDGMTAKGNFFKYGSRLPKRHFLSWNEVGQTGKPNFHQTDKFGKIVFDKR